MKPMRFWFSVHSCLSLNQKLFLFLYGGRNGTRDQLSFSISRPQKKNRRVAGTNIAKPRYSRYVAGCFRARSLFKEILVIRRSSAETREDEVSVTEYDIWPSSGSHRPRWRARLQKADKDLGKTITKELSLQGEASKGRRVCRFYGNGQRNGGDKGGLDTGKKAEFLPVHLFPFEGGCGGGRGFRGAGRGPFAKALVWSSIQKVLVGHACLLRARRETCLFSGRTGPSGQTAHCRGPAAEICFGD